MSKRQNLSPQRRRDDARNAMCVVRALIKAGHEEWIKYYVLPYMYPPMPPEAKEFIRNFLDKLSKRKEKDLGIQER